MLLQSTGPGQAWFLSTQAQIFANWSLAQLSGAYQTTRSIAPSNEHKPKHAIDITWRNSPLTTQIFLLTSQFYWKAICKMGRPDFLRCLTSRICSSNDLNKRNCGRCPWMALHSSESISNPFFELHDFQVAKFIIIISISTVYREQQSLNSLPRFSRQLLQRSSNFLWGLAFNGISSPFFICGWSTRDHTPKND